MEEGHDRRANGRAIARFVAHALAWTLVAVLALVLSLLVHLDTDDGRWAVAEIASALVSDLLTGDLHIERIDALNLTEVRAGPASLRDADGRVLARVQSVAVEFDALALLDGEIHADAVMVDGPWADLTIDDSGQLLLVQQVLLAHPSPEPPSDGGSEVPPIHIDRVEVRNAAADGLPDGLVARDGELDGRFDLAPEVRVEVTRLTANILRDGQPVAAVSELAGVFDMTPGSVSEASTRVVADEDFVAVEARTSWTDEGLGPVTARAELALSPELARHFGLSAVEAAVHSDVRGTVTLDGTLEDVEVLADLETDGGGFEVSASRHGDVGRVGFVADELNLGEISPLLEGMSARGRADLEIQPLDAEERHAVLRVENAHYDEWTVPEATVRAQIEDDGVLLESIDLPHLTDGGGHLDAEGRVGFDGSMDVRLDARIPQLARDENLRRLVPGVRGGVTTNVRARIDMGAESGDAPTIDVQGTLVATALHAPGLSANRLSARGLARGRLATPVVDLHLEGGGVRAGGVVVRNLALDLRGGPRHYRAAGNVQLEDGASLELDATAEVVAGNYGGDASLVVRGLWPEPVRVELRDYLFVPDRAFSFARLSAESEGLSLVAEGRYGLRGPSDLRADIAEIDLGPLGRLINSPMLSGVARAQLTFGGTVRNPELEVSGAIRDMAAGPFEVPEIDLEAALSSERRTLTLEVRADAAGYGRIVIDDDATLGDAASLVERITHGTHQLSVELEDAPATLLALASPDLPPFDGTVDARITARGSIEAPTIEAVVSAEDFAFHGVEPLNFDLRAGYEEGRVSATLSAVDASGPLLAATGDAALDLTTLIDGRPFDPLAIDGTVRLSVPSRRVDRLPIAMDGSIPINASLEATVARSGGQTTLDASGQAERWGGAETAEGCIPGPMPTLAYEVHLSDGAATAVLRGDVGGHPVGEARISAAVPIDEWLVTAFPDAAPALTVDARISRLDLARVPMLCSHANGIATLNIEGRDVLTPNPTLDVEGTVEELTVGGSPSVEFRFAAGLDDEGAAIEALMHHDGRSIVELTGRAPVTMGDDGLTPALRDEPWDAHLTLDRSPASVVLGFAPILAQPEGALDGRIDVRGVGMEVSPSGRIALSAVSFVVRDPVVRVDQLGGTIEFDEDGVELRDLTMRDRSGTLGLSGTVGLDRLMPRSVDVQLDIDDWPLRAEGLVFAYLSSDVAIEGEFDESQREIRTKLTSFSVEMPEEMGHGVQPLDQHPDVIYEDQPGFYPGSEVEDEEDSVEEEDEGGVPTRIFVDARRPFWIRRDDFSVQLTADLRVDIEGSRTRITGPVKVKRGWLNLVGRSFDFEEGEIIFDGGASVDPTLEITAVHTLQSRETVTVKITGRLTMPDIHFSTTVPGVETEADVIELLVSGRSSGAGSTMDAKDQAVSVLGGMAAGFISSMTRRSMGAYIPRLSIESGGTGSTRIRAGINADALIPDFLSGVIQSAYVEGFVGSSETQTNAAGQSSETGTRGGFLIEFYWPHDIVTTGSYEQPTNWAVDITWEP